MKNLIKTTTLIALLTIPNTFADVKTTVFKKAVGELIKFHRNSLKLTQTQVAKELNITFQQVQKYENGTNNVSLDRLFQISKILKKQVKDFIPENLHKQFGFATTKTEATFLEELKTVEKLKSELTDLLEKLTKFK